MELSDVTQLKKAVFDKLLGVVSDINSSNQTPIFLILD